MPDIGSQSVVQSVLEIICVIQVDKLDLWGQSFLQWLFGKVWNDENASLYMCRNWIFVAFEDLTCTVSLPAL